VDANEEALAAGFWTVLVAEVVGGARGLSLAGEGAAAQLGEGVPDNILLHFKCPVSIIVTYVTDHVHSKKEQI
jgi:hypothetical protein